MIRCKNACPKNPESNICCVDCEYFSTCDDACSEHYTACEDVLINEETSLELFNRKYDITIQQMKAVIVTKKQLEEQEKQFKDRLKEAMEQYGIKSIDNDLMKVTYIGETTETRIDSAKLKKKYPDIADECSKTSKKSSYIKVEVK